MSPQLQGSNCLLLTSAALRMLVPRAVVAEVLAPSFLEFARDEVSGLEFFGWRGRRVPLLGGPAIGASHAAAAPEPGAEARIAVFYGLKHQQLLPFYGFVVTRSPRLLRVAEGDIEEVTGVQLHPAELMRVRVEGVDACIPRIDHFETTLIGQMKTLAQ
jgi:hypothetical protein